jgi:hypothetical protein
MVDSTTACSSAPLDGNLPWLDFVTRLAPAPYKSFWTNTNIGFFPLSVKFPQFKTLADPSDDHRH